MAVIQKTWAAGATLLADQLNLHLRDWNNASALGVSTARGEIFFATDERVLAALSPPSGLAILTMGANNTPMWIPFITDAQIADATIAAGKLVAESIVAGQLADDLLLARHFPAGVIVAAAIGPDAITSNAIGDAQLLPAHLGSELTPFNTLQNVRYIANRIAPDTAGPVVALAPFRGAVGELYAFSYDGDDMWLVDDTNPASSTKVGDLPSGVEESEGAAQFDSRIYVWTQDPSDQDKLSIIDPVSPANTISPFGVVGNLFDLGNLGTLFTSGDDLLAIDPSSHLFGINPNNPNDESGDFGDRGSITGLSGGGVRAGTTHDGTTYVFRNREMYSLNVGTRAATSLGNIPGTQSPTGAASFDGKLLVVTVSGLGGRILNINPSNPSDESGDYGLVGNFPSALTSPRALIGYELEATFFDSDGTTERSFVKAGDVFYVNAAGDKWVHRPAGLASIEAI